MGLLMLAVLLPVGHASPGPAPLRRRQRQPGLAVHRRGGLQHRRRRADRPGLAAEAGPSSVTATAASDRGITSVVFSSAPAGTSTWTVACTKTVPPYTCTFDTTTVADGLRDVRAVATDSAGYSRTDTVAQPPRRQHRADRDDDRSRLAADRHRHRRRHRRRRRLGPRQRVARVPLDARGVDELCTQATSPISCAWNTTALADGLYDLRTVATDVAGNQTISAPVYNRRVDNTAPTVTLTDPGTPLEGTITLASTTGDGAGSGVSSVRYEYKLGAGAWTTACTGATAPFSCTFNTGRSPTASTTSARSPPTASPRSRPPPRSTARRIDNSAPTAVTLGAVGDPLQDTVRLTGTATDRRLGRRLAALPVRPRRHVGVDRRLHRHARRLHLLVRHHRRRRRPLRHALARDRQRGQHDRLDRADQPPHRQPRPRRRDHEPARGGPSAGRSRSPARRPTPPA